MGGKFVATVVLLLVLVIGYSNYKSNQKRDRLAENGVLAEAIAPSQYTERTRNGIRTYSIQLKFVTQDGQAIFAGSHNVSADTVNKFANGETVMVQYLPSDPSVAVVIDD